MIKTIEIAPDIVAAGLAKHICDNYYYIQDTWEEIDQEKLRDLIKEYLNR